MIEEKKNSCVTLNTIYPCSAVPITVDSILNRGYCNCFFIRNMFFILLLRCPPWCRVVRSSFSKADRTVISCFGEPNQSRRIPLSSDAPCAGPTEDHFIRTQDTKPSSTVLIKEIHQIMTEWPIGWFQDFLIFGRKSRQLMATTVSWVQHVNRSSVFEAGSQGLGMNL